MKNFVFYICCFFAVACQPPKQSDSAYSGTFMSLAPQDFDTLHATYKETSIAHRRFKHADIATLIARHDSIGILSVARIGQSAQGRSISELTYGNGGKKVMLWSQMHGDEPTATMVLFDLFNFLEAQDDGWDSVRTLLTENLEIHFIPMLNPDGAEIYHRRNAQSIDINRDARATETVEGKLLTARAKVVQPAYGFNLHDQSIYYHVPDSRNPVTISLLAPAYNVEREVNETRGNAMRIIGGINKLLQQYIPDAVAKYDDTYSPRGFGDNFQAWGASTVLIESGGLKGDPEKQTIRKLNFAIILNALLEIAQGSYQQYSVDDYDAIPFNGAGLLHDVVIHNLAVGTDSIPLKVDVAIRRAEITEGNDFYVRGWVEDVGDLVESFGYDDLDADGLHFVPANANFASLRSLAELTPEKSLDLMRKGFLAARLPLSAGSGYHTYPILLYATSSFFPTAKIELGGTANFYIADAAGDLKYAVVNGYLVDLSKPATASFRNKIY